MIVDLLRNDLSRIAAPASVRVKRLFELERYPSLWQMTSTVTARTDADLPTIFKALFPCGSVTGAPKIEAMRIIRELEPWPRGLYCGSLGWWGPGRRACFNVAIRTVVLNTATGRARYHVGGGITHDSIAHAEYRECLAKTRVLRPGPRNFELLETLRLTNNFLLLDGHLARLGASAAYFGFRLDLAGLNAALDALCRAPVGDSGPRRVKVRILLRKSGAFRILSAPLEPPGRFRIRLSKTRVRSDNPLLYHKTTARGFYEQARAEIPEVDDVVLRNERGELTETTRANLVLKIEGRLQTPALNCGLLPGVFRRRLLERGLIREAILKPTDLKRAQAVYLINSVRLRFPADLG